MHWWCSLPLLDIGYEEFYLEFRTQNYTLRLGILGRWVMCRLRWRHYSNKLQ